MTLVFDIETDGLLQELTQLHCISIFDTETNTILSYNDTGAKEPIIRGIQRLEDADRIVGHGIINFDIPAIRKIYGWFCPPDDVIDTLLLSRLFLPNMMEVDKKTNKDGMPMLCYGRHSLESWGYRVGEYKGNFAKDTDWKEWSQAMEDYCDQDVRVTLKTCETFRPYLSGSK